MAEFWPTIQQLLVQWVDMGRQRPAETLPQTTNNGGGRRGTREMCTTSFGYLSCKSEIGVVVFGREGSCAV
jgi:hypothetical protein